MKAIYVRPSIHATKFENALGVDNCRLVEKTVVHWVWEGIGYTTEISMRVRIESD